jgi:hypothetical protein
MISLQQTIMVDYSALNTAWDFIDHIYEISMKISLD